MDNAEPHDWHPFDIDNGLEVRQATGPDEANRWEVRKVDENGATTGEVTALTDDEFDQLRETGQNPKGL